MADTASAHAMFFFQRMMATPERRTSLQFFYSKVPRRNSPQKQCACSSKRFGSIDASRDVDSACLIHRL
jgi:hypothetical protein